MAQFEYPLTWPLNFPRTPPMDRAVARFGKRDDRGTLRELTIPQATKRLFAEVSAFTRAGQDWRINWDDVIVSTMLRVRRSDSLPDAAQKAPIDPGVAVFFELDGESYCLPCDKWTTVADNLAAVAAHLNAIRGIENWGVGDLRAQFKGFQALPDPNRIIWRDVLGFEPGARPSRDELVAEFRVIRSKRHPDRGGTPLEFDRVVKAFDLACAELGYSS